MEWLDNYRLRRLFKNEENYMAVIELNKRSIKHFKAKLIQNKRDILNHVTKLNKTFIDIK